MPAFDSGPCTGARISKVKTFPGSWNSRSNAALSVFAYFHSTPATCIPLARGAKNLQDGCRHFAECRGQAWWTWSDSGPGRRRCPAGCCLNQPVILETAVEICERPLRCLCRGLSASLCEQQRPEQTRSTLHPHAIDARRSFPLGAHQCDSP